MNQDRFRSPLFRRRTAIVVAVAGLLALMLPDAAALAERGSDKIIISGEDTLLTPPPAR